MFSLCVFGRQTSFLHLGLCLKNFMSLIMLHVLWRLHSLSVVRFYGQESSKHRLIGSATLKPQSRIRSWRWGDKATGFWDLGSEKSGDDSASQWLSWESHKACVVFWLRARSGVHLLYLISPSGVIVFLLLLLFLGGGGWWSPSLAREDWKNLNH